MENKVIPLYLRLSEVEDILRVLGELPTKSGAYPLMTLIKGQVESIINTDKAAEVPEKTLAE